MEPDDLMVIIWMASMTTFAALALVASIIL